MYIVELR